MPEWDHRPCRRCGKTLYECYDGPRYKGDMNCCDWCNHPARETLAREQEEALSRAAALAKLSAREIELLGLNRREAD